MSDKTKVVDTRIYCSGPDLTQQSSKDECDINLIVERAKRGAAVSHLSGKAPMYGDFTSIPSYVDAMNIVNRARSAFMSMDAFVRERFGNDPELFLRFFQDPKNRDEAVRLGLIKAPVAPPAPVSEAKAESLDSEPGAPVGKAHKGSK